MDWSRCRWRLALEWLVCNSTCSKCYCRDFSRDSMRAAINHGSNNSTLAWLKLHVHKKNTQRTSARPRSYSEYQCCTNMLAFLQRCGRLLAPSLPDDLTQLIPFTDTCTHTQRCFRKQTRLKQIRFKQIRLPTGAPEGHRFKLSLATLTNQNARPGLSNHRPINPSGLLKTQTPQSPRATPAHVRRRDSRLFFLATHALNQRHTYQA